MENRKIILYLEFKKPVNFKNGYIAKCLYPIGKNPVVEITDIAKDWALNLVGVKNRYNNPKLKEMTRNEFHQTFKITQVDGLS